MRTCITILILTLLFLPAQLRAEPHLRVGSIKGLTDSWHKLGREATLPASGFVVFEFKWGRNLSDFNADGLVNLEDYATLAICTGGPDSPPTSSCTPEDHAAADLDADGDVDADDEALFRQAHQTRAEFVVENVTWEGAREISLAAHHSRAQVDLSEPGRRTIRVEATLFDPTTGRRLIFTRSTILNVQSGSINTDWGLAVDGTDTESRATRSRVHYAQHPEVELRVFAWSTNPLGLGQLSPGDLVHFQVGASLQEYDSQGTPNAGLAGVVYDVHSPEAQANSYWLSEMRDVPSGFTNFTPDPVLFAVGDPYYRFSESTTQPFYHGGWGFGRSGLPGGGDAAWVPGLIIAAGVMAPLTWVADNNLGYPGLQPLTRLGVGHALYIFPPDDPVLAGKRGGFGQDFSNSARIIEGDGTWVFQKGVVDTAGWEPQTYNFHIISEGGGVAVFDGSLDFGQDYGGGFRLLVADSAVRGADFSFTLRDGPPDCNHNGTDDADDIAQGTSNDCNHNNVPDECEPDCNTSGIPDDCDIAGGSSDDCNGNGIPDDCEPDCNVNDVADACEPDSDHDGHIDDCDLCTDSDGDGFGDPGFPNNACPPDACPHDPHKSEPGLCGCGAADTDSDADGAPNCLDLCVFDPNKTEPGFCGCGVADTDTNGDEIPDCDDHCPDDPDKTEPGICGCGVQDADSDGDATADCIDECPHDPAKTTPGLCGCGLADTDIDGDQSPDCVDQCPADPNKTAPGQCGCGTPDTDADVDGTSDCADACPLDPHKITPDICGCGVADSDDDGDGAINCLDGCPQDSGKTDPGVCGCGVLDADNDDDGSLNCQDECPFDPDKTEHGDCGCGVADEDLDGDGVADCFDHCLGDPLKSAPGLCGCGIPDNDSDGDGYADCLDGCPHDPLKNEMGVCGCGHPDADSDFDGTLDCLDGCPENPLRTEPGVCGCVVPDRDTDQDGVPNCVDGCPFDERKTDPGSCGCGLVDEDSDGDLMLDCHDGCPQDPNKIIVGVCGCFVPDTDSDGDALPDCVDAIYNPPGDGPFSRAQNVPGFGGMCGAVGVVAFGMTAVGFVALLITKRRVRATRRSGKLPER